MIRPSTTLRFALAAFAVMTFASPSQSWDGAAEAAQAEAPPLPASTVPADMRPWKTLFESSTWSVRMINRVQFRWTEDMPDEAVRLAGTSAPGESKGAFRVRRAKTAFEGFVWNEHFTYDLQLSWAGPEPGASTQTPLEDALFTWDISKKKTFMLSFGQMKAPFGRQEFTSSANMQFADRDILSFDVTRGRDLGLQVSGAVANDRLTYMAGVFNGNPASRLGNDNTKYQFDARVTFEPWGSVGYDEPDFQSTTRPLLAVSAQFESNDQKGSTDSLNDFDTRILGADVVFKYRGFSTFVEYFARHRDGEVGPAFDSNAWHAQAGYFIIRDRLEVALRRAQIDHSDLVDNDDQSETGGAVSYYVRKHALKVQADFRRIKDESRDIANDEIRVQAQVMF